MWHDWKALLYNNDKQLGSWAHFTQHSEKWERNPDHIAMESSIRSGLEAVFFKESISGKTRYNFFFLLKKLRLKLLIKCRKKSMFVSSIFQNIGVSIFLIWVAYFDSFIVKNIILKWFIKKRERERINDALKISKIGWAIFKKHFCSY